MTAVALSRTTLPGLYSSKTVWSIKQFVSPRQVKLRYICLYKISRCVLYNLQEIKIILHKWRVDLHSLNQCRKISLEIFKPFDVNWSCVYLRQPDEIPKQEYSQKSSSACQKNTSPVPATQVLEVSRPPKSSQHDVHTVQFKKQDKGKILRIKTPVWDVLGLDLDLPIWIPALQQLQSWTNCGENSLQETVLALHAHNKSYVST